MCIVSYRSYLDDISFIVPQTTALVLRRDKAGMGCLHIAIIGPWTQAGLMAVMLLLETLFSLRTILPCLFIHIDIVSYRIDIISYHIVSHRIVLLVVLKEIAYRIAC